MMSTLDKIRSRGHWRVNIYPSEFQQGRVSSLADLERIFRDCHVELRGWDYPHDPKEGVNRGADYIQGMVSWAHYYELWRLYQSGQFMHYFGMREDWYEEGRVAGIELKPGTVLSVTSTLYTITEFFLFAARLTERVPLGPDVTVSYKLIGIAGRQLQTLDPGRARLLEWRKASTDINEYGNDVTVAAAELIARAKDLAIDQAIQVYERFHWDPARDAVAEDQRRFLERRL